MAPSKEKSSPPRKLALVIGNGNYSSPNNSFEHAINNANDVSAALEKIKFNVTLITDIKESILDKISEFAETINDGDTVLFYYCGQVYQGTSEGFFIPIDDSKIKHEKDIQIIGSSIQNSIRRLKKKNPSHVTIFILDTPLTYSIPNKTTKEKGLHYILPSIGTFIQYSCSPNQTVPRTPSTDRNTLFTKYFIKFIQEENLNINILFRRINDAVFDRSNGKQKPLSMNGLQLPSETYLNKLEKEDDDNNENDDQSIDETDIIDQSNKLISQLQLEVETLALKRPHEGGLYNPAECKRIDKLRMSIHLLTLRRNNAIVKKYSHCPI